MKKEQVVNLFHRKADFKETIINETVGMENPWYYRNKSQIPLERIKKERLSQVL